jgi:multisubunit Na+/H+ antiporter MnhB subunit
VLSAFGHSALVGQTIVTGKTSAAASLAVAVVLSCLGAVAAVLTVSAAAGHGYAATGLGFAGNVVVGIVAVCIMFVSGWWAVHAEHRLRHRGPHEGATGTGHHRDHPEHRHGPASSTALVLIYGVFLAMTVPGLVSSYNDAARSHATQHTGLLRPGTITDVDLYVQVQVHRSTGPSYTYASSQSQVELLTEFEGRSSVGVHYPNVSDLPGGASMVGSQTVAVGQAVHVLVDPSDPVYAEFPGQPVAGDASWIVPLLFILGALAPLFLHVRSVARHVLRRLHQHPQGCS